MFFLYLLLWLIFSMRISVETLATGVVISAAVYWFACVHLRYKPGTDVRLLRRLSLGIKYALVIIWETAKANAIVFRVVFSKKIKVEPHFVYFRTDLKSNALQVALASSINLTPGTITISLEDGLFCIHCLNRELSEGIENSLFVRYLRKLDN